MFNPFANSATDNMLVRAEFIREVAKSANIRDETGKLKPVIMLASPGVHGSKLNLDRDEKRQIRHGDLGPAAKELLGAVAARGYGKVALLGFSGGADMALAGARLAYSRNLDIGGLSIGDPAGVENRESLSILAKDFYAAAPNLEQSAREFGLAALDEARSGKGEYTRFILSGLHPINWSVIARGLGHDLFEENMQTVINEDRMLKRTLDKVVGYGGTSAITKPELIEPSLARLRDRIMDEDNRLISIRVDGKDHSWGDQLPLLAKLYLKALT